MTRPLRLRPALALAAAAHVLASLPLLAVHTTGPVEAVGEVHHEISLDIDSPRPEGLVAPSDAPSEARAKTEVAPSANGTLSAHTREARTPSSPEPAVASASSAAPGAPWAFDPLRPAASDIGLGSHWKTVVAAGAAEANGHDAGGNPRDDARAVERSMRDELAALDAALGLGRASPLVSALHRAAAATNAPAIGAATLEVECDASGAVIAARADDRAWAPVAEALVRNMGGKTLRLARGARGLRARLRVVAERTLPSGPRGGSSIGAVPDDAPGANKACDGDGLARRCVAGMPLGATNAQHDTSNLGASASRIVRVQLLGESEL